MAKKRICDAAVEILRETDNPAVMWGDNGLLDQIGLRAGIRPCKSQFYADQILRALSRTPGILLKGFTRCGGRKVLIFRLPEHTLPPPGHH